MNHTLFARFFAVLALCVGSTFGVTGCLDAPLTEDEINARIDEQSPEYPTPLLLAECLANRCGDNANDCQSTCFAQASDAAKVVGQKLWECWKPTCHEGDCKTSPDPACMNTCLISRCGGHVIESVKTAKSGDQDCGSAMNCLSLCDATKPGLFPCYEDCYSRATKDGQAGLQQLAECAAANPTTADSSCHAQLVACYSATVADSGLCHTFAPCAEACTGNDNQKNACFQQCRDKLSADEKPKYDALVPCFEGGKLGSPKCQQALMTCIDPVGTHTCIATYQCQALCSSKVSDLDNIGCLYSCMRGADANVTSDVLGVGACSGDGADAKACSKALVACAQPSGSGLCKDIQPCVTTCGQDDESQTSSCILECMHTATSDAAQAYANLLACFVPCQASCKNKQTCETVCQAKCGKEINACSKG